MTLTNFDGGFTGRIGYNTDLSSVGPIAATGFTIDAADEAIIFIGHIVTSDGGSHTIDTTGSSSLNWRAGSPIVFSNAGTTVKVGLAAVDTANGPPGRAANTTNVINFDVSKTMVGSGSPAIVTNTWHTHVPDAGTKTIANGALVAFAIQMTARGGSDTVVAGVQSAVNNVNFPQITTYIGTVYTLNAASPNCMIVFADGARGWFFGSEVYSTLTTTTMNSGGATKEYGQLFKMPFPMRIYGLYGITTGTAADFDMVLYSDPLGTPVAQRTVAVDANTLVSASQRRINVLFPTPYDTTADQLIGAVYKAGATNVFAYRKTLGAAADRITDVWGTDGYAISRATGAFADLNSGLDHMYIGLFVGGFGNDAGGGGGGMATPLFGGGIV